MGFCLAELADRLTPALARVELCSSNTKLLWVKSENSCRRSQNLLSDTLPPGHPPLYGKHVSDLVRQFQTSVLPSLKGQKQEASRLRRINAEFGSVLAHELRNHHLAAYRDRRLREVGPQTVKHEINLLRRILKLASDEWGITLPNGVPTIRMPRLPRGRERRVSEEELSAIKSHLTPIMAAIIAIAVETAMRRSEILRLQRQDLLPEDRLRVRESKNGRSRIIPANSLAVNAFETLFSASAPKRDSVSQAFSRACVKSGISGMHFYDLRHEAISRMFAQGLTVPEAAAISDHLDFMSDALADGRKIRSFNVIDDYNREGLA